MRNKIVPVGNVMRAMEACKALLARSAGMPGMGLCYGSSGLGKTTAVAWLATRENGVYVRARATSTPTSLLDTIGRELNLALKQRVDLKVDAIVEKLAQTGRPLFIDEADYVVGKDGENRLANTVRDLHDLATVPVILIGMAGIDRRIALSPQLSGRMAQWVEFAGCSEADAQKLADELLDVRVAPDMVHVC
ncbi:ATP-binding protein [Thermomonas sp.]|uniref:AAA family ATPase n=1 Tax=Thermomonas sp. TaxID=1971895 RepID=UPI0026383101|nr:ATP-binding protein [Thermomonas sp.]